MCFVVVSHLLLSSFQLLSFLITVGHASRDRNKKKQRCTLRIVNLVVITHDVLLAKPLLCLTTSFV